MSAQTQFVVVKADRDAKGPYTQTAIVMYDPLSTEPDPEMCWTVKAGAHPGGNIPVMEWSEMAQLKSSYPFITGQVEKALYQAEKKRADKMQKLTGIRKVAADLLLTMLDRVSA